MNALVVYTPPQTALAIIPRKRDPLPPRSFVYAVGQTVIIPVTQYEIGVAGVRIVCSFVAAKVVKRERQNGENWYVVHVARQEGRTFGFKEFPFKYRESDVRLDVGGSIASVEQRFARSVSIVGARLGSHLAA